MAAETPHHAAESIYAATGIAGLDRVLGGGVLRRHLYIIGGAPGAGKTTLALHFLLAGRKNHARCLWLTTAETPDELRGTAHAHGWSLEGIRVYSCTAADIEDICAAP
jgi:circadian clock protein KaiC